MARRVQGPIPASPRTRQKRALRRLARLTKKRGIRVKKPGDALKLYPKPRRLQRQLRGE